MSYDAFDHLETRCPQMGHQIDFGYCRRVKEGLPCPKAIDCFYLKFPVERYFRLVLREETFAAIFLEQGLNRYEKLLKVVHDTTAPEE
jgi:hypothetical protein